MRKPKGYYGSLHQRLRRQLLAERIWCEWCGKNFASEAHHLQPGKLATSVQDYAALCSDCHRAEHR